MKEECPFTDPSLRLRGDLGDALQKCVRTLSGGSDLTAGSQTTSWGKTVALRDSFVAVALGVVGYSAAIKLYIYEGFLK